MQLISEILHEAIADELEQSENPDEVDESKLAHAVLKSALPEVRLALEHSLRKKSPKMLREHRKLDQGFRQRNLRRWKPAFDLLEMIWVISQEVGGEYNQQPRPSAAEHDDFKFGAVSELHARALLVTREIICLLEGGYPDGALARWRTLHEIAVVARLLKDGDQQLAYRYLASFRFNALKAARQYNKYADRANLSPFSDEEIEGMEKDCAQLACEIEGAPFKKDYDWAEPIIGKKQPTLLDLEEKTGLDHWRPRYRWACQHNHAGYRPPEKLLGATESQRQLLLVGASNSGFVDPLHMTAISLNIVNSAFFLDNPNVDRLVVVELIQTFADELGETAIQVEKESLEKARQNQTRRFRIPWFKLQSSGDRE